jgi:hydroxymethylbilane synthase
MSRPIIIATRGSALALAQSNMITAQCRAEFPGLQFELKIIKTTGDKLQKASMAKVEGGLPKGLFTKELEVAVLKGHADMAIHSLKDLPTDLPEGLVLAATPKREDVRDVLVYRATGGKLRGFKPQAKLSDFPKGATIATSSTRRKAQLLAVRPDLHIVEIRGNVPTRMQKVVDEAELDATVLAFAGITRLNFKITSKGKLLGDGVPDGLLATLLDVETMLPCVGQAAIGIEIRVDDPCIAQICEKLNHPQTFQCVTAERAFLRSMGGGCQSPVAAYARIAAGKIHINAVSFHHTPARRTKGTSAATGATALGEKIAAKLK